MKLNLWIFTCSITLLLHGCSGTKEVYIDNNETIQSNIRKHIQFLASDALEGRETGSAGELAAANYVADRFKAAGLQPKGTKKYLQPFPFTSGATYGTATQLYINDDKYTAPTDFYPLPLSANKVVTAFVARVGYGIYAPALQQDDYKGKTNIVKKIFVIDAGSPDGNNPHGKFAEYDLNWRVTYAISRGAVAVVFITNDSTDVKADFKIRTSSLSIPVIFARGKAAAALQNAVILNCTVGAEIIPTIKTGHNVLGYIDNKKATTVVIGAHLDHLGYGHEGSLHRGEKAIHNGADDNASGTATIIELAKFFKSGKAANNNYLFIGFSGEEKGLLGSNYFIKNPTIPKSKINYMINLDMVGRINPSDPKLQIHGSGTSPIFAMAIDTNGMNGLPIATVPSGVGPSDHTSFYLDSIPALHFFSGTHSDYHKPSDDENLINYDGTLRVFKTITQIIIGLNNKGKAPYVKTKDENMSEKMSFKVTLGVVPDYSFTGEGMRIDGVSEGKPAAKAGLLKGDVVIQLGSQLITDMQTYMKALGKFSKGETTTVKVKRGTDTVEKAITF
ncbi:MAG: hypothetical protein RIQ89_1151 [Bacteroidota bacterium]